MLQLHHHHHQHPCKTTLWLIRFDLIWHVCVSGVVHCDMFTMRHVHNATCSQASTIRMAGQPPSPIATTHPTSSDNHDDHTIGSRPSAIGSIDGDSQRVDVPDLLIAAACSGHLIKKQTHTRTYSGKDVANNYCD
jgi:hypothetical protein